MNSSPERLSRTIWVGVGLVIILLCGTFVIARLSPRSTPKPQLPVIGSITDFALTNQAGQFVSLADLRGRVWVADIIFTRCGGPCPRMTKQMALLQAALPADSRAKLVTLTTDPEFDTPEVLQKYSARFNVNAERWLFLTGTKQQIAALGIDSLKLTAVEKKPEDRTDADDLFIHSTIFVIVDKQGRLRGAFETGGDSVEWTNVQPTILTAVQQLEREP
ncbi:MAG: SCO family protein [Verrucomicrobiota bacterium]|jgi:protein SCO1|nr:SCO family protein [Verrucomicrobiota bacterium]MCC6822267.1 SCO family protein [Limisphaerales bacterium]